MGCNSSQSVPVQVDEKAQKSSPISRAVSPSVVQDQQSLPRNLNSEETSERPVSRAPTPINTTEEALPSSRAQSRAISKAVSRAGTPLNEPVNARVATPIYSTSRVASRAGSTLNEQKSRPVSQAGSRAVSPRNAQLEDLNTEVKSVARLASRASNFSEEELDGEEAKDDIKVPSLMGEQFYEHEHGHVHDPLDVPEFRAASRVVSRAASRLD